METNNLYIWSIKNIKSNRISIHAAQVAFFIMVSFFPFLMFLFTLLGFSKFDANSILKLLDNCSGKVILSSKLLEKYIRSNFSNIEIVASVLKITMEDGKNNLAYYKNLETNYNSYVVHPDDNFNNNLLSQLNTDKAEILLNERCYYNCKNRKLHYQSIDREQISQSEGRFQDERFLERCNAIPEKKQFNSNKRNICISLSEYESFYKMGFRKFKIQGRTNNLYLFFFDLLRYSIDSDISISLIYPIICEYIDEFLKRRV